MGKNWCTSLLLWNAINIVTSRPMLIVAKGPWQNARTAETLTIPLPSPNRHLRRPQSTFEALEMDPQSNNTASPAPATKQASLPPNVKTMSHTTTSAANILQNLFWIPAVTADPEKSRVPPKTTKSFWVPNDQLAPKKPDPTGFLPKVFRVVKSFDLGFEEEGRFRVGKREGAEFFGLPFGTDQGMPVENRDIIVSRF